jgi:hypothetical protein
MADAKATDSANYAKDSTCITQQLESASFRMKATHDLHICIDLFLTPLQFIVELNLSAGSFKARLHCHPTRCEAALS